MCMEDVKGWPRWCAELRLAEPKQSYFYNRTADVIVNRDLIFYHSAVDVFIA